MNPDPRKQAGLVLLVLGGGAVLVGAGYQLAGYQADSRTSALGPAYPGVMVPLGQEPVEARGVEGVASPEGLIVTALDGPARRSGLRVGDLILSAGGRRLFSPAQLASGVSLQVQREGQTVDFTFVPNPGRGNARETRTIDVRGLDGELTAEGLWVNAVEGDARSWGLRRGDLVRSINGRQVHVRRDATMLLRSIGPRTPGSFEVVRDGGRIFLGADPGLASAGRVATQPRAVAGDFNGFPAARSGMIGSGWLGTGHAGQGSYCPVCGTRHVAGVGAGAAPQQRLDPAGAAAGSWPPVAAPRQARGAFEVRR